MNRAKWYLFWAPLYHLITLVGCLFVLVLTIFCTLLWPLMSTVGIGLMCWFIYVRFAVHWRPFKNRKKRELGLLPPLPPTEAEQREIEAKRRKEERKEQTFRRIQAYGNGYYYCRTCGCPYSVQENFTCYQQGVPIHRVKDDPPKPNPYEWWSFQRDGLPPPPFPPDTNVNPYVDRAWGEDSWRELKAKGQSYYSQHINHAWDSGQGEIPEWYAPKCKAPENRAADFRPSQQPLPPATPATSEFAHRVIEEATKDGVLRPVCFIAASGTRAQATANAIARQRGGKLVATDAGKIDHPRVLFEVVSPLKDNDVVLIDAIDGLDAKLKDKLCRIIDDKLFDIPLANGKTIPIKLDSFAVLGTTASRELLSNDLHSRFTFFRTLWLAGVGDD